MAQVVEVRMNKSPRRMILHGFRGFQYAPGAPLGKKHRGSSHIGATQVGGQLETFPCERHFWIWNPQVIIRQEEPLADVGLNRDIQVQGRARLPKVLLGQRGHPLQVHGRIDVPALPLLLADRIRYPPGPKYRFRIRNP